jgi:ribonuclease HII
MATSNKCLSINYKNDSSIVEIGVDEAGRGPLFGRVYAAAVVLPTQFCSVEFNPMLIKDSKKFSSKKKLTEAYEHIKTHAIAYHVSYSSEKEIDILNIRRATHKAMHEAIKNVILKLNNLNSLTNENEHLPHISLSSYLLCIDGNDFTNYHIFNTDTQKIDYLNHVCIIDGDNSYAHIAAASILAKVERDTYVTELCKENPYLDEHYGLSSNKGYGAKIHIEGIKKYGITQWHRKTFGICKLY